jgi:hypothetical protein
MEMVITFIPDCHFSGNYRRVYQVLSDYLPI